MPSVLLAGPAVEPLTMAEVKAFLRLEHDDDDAVVEALLAAARAHVEAMTRRALITQDWRLVRDAWPGNGRLPVIPVPLQQPLAARVYRSDGSTLPVGLSAVVVDTISAPAVLDFSAMAPPAPERATAGVEIDVRVGYGDAASDVPEPLRLAVRLLVAHWYENRGLVAVGASLSPVPATVDALITPYRVLGI